MATHTPSYQMHTKVPVKHTRGKHLIALVGVPAIVLAAVWAVWNVLKEQCAALSTAQCLPVGSTDLGGTEVAGQKRGALGRWVQLRRRRRHAEAPPEVPAATEGARAGT